MAKDTEHARSRGREREIMPFAEEPSLGDVARIAARAVAAGDEEIRRFCVLSLATGLDPGIATLVGPCSFQAGHGLVVPPDVVRTGTDGWVPARSWCRQRVALLPPSAMAEISTWSGDPWIGIGTAQLRRRLDRLQADGRPGCRLRPSSFRRMLVEELHRRSPCLGAARIRAWLGLRHESPVCPELRFEHVNTAPVVAAAELVLREAHARSGGVLLLGAAAVGDEGKVG